MMPGQPSAADDGLNGLRLFAEPSLMITKTKKAPTTMIETRASTSWLRVEIRTPKYRIAPITAMRIAVHAQDGSGSTPNSAAIVPCR